MIRRLGAVLLATSCCAMTGACTIAPSPEGATAPGDVDELPPPGYGTLRQEQISIALASGGLQIMVTPLDESITRVTAPDTYERLSSIAEAYRREAPPGSELFLVSFYSDQAEARFVPEDVQLVSRGFRVRPEAILPITPGWGQRRVGQRQTEMAVYAFPGELPMESDLLLVYGLDQSGGWSAVLPRVQAERARARARAGIGG